LLVNEAERDRRRLSISKNIQKTYTIHDRLCGLVVRVPGYRSNRSTLDIGVLGYIGILYHKEHPPEVWHIPPGTPVCVYIHIYIYIYIYDILGIQISYTRLEAQE
jgi:hypothetical protein